MLRGTIVRKATQFLNALSNGRPITLPAGNFQFDGAEYVLFSDRNAYRIRIIIDFGLNYDYKEKSTKNVGFHRACGVMF